MSILFNHRLPLFLASWSVLLGLFLFPLVVDTAPNAQVGDVRAGDFVRKDGQTSVHYVGDDGKRQFLPFEWTYKTWREDFSRVKVLPRDTDLDRFFPSASRPLIGPRPGSVLMKSPDSPRLYAVGCGGLLHWVTSQTALSALYGTTWEFHDMPGYLLALFPQGESLDGTKPHCGQVVRFAAGGDVYVVGEDGQYYQLIGNIPSVVRRIQLLTQNQRAARGVSGSLFASSQVVTDPSQRRSGVLRGPGVASSPTSTTGGGGGGVVTPPAATPYVVVTRNINEESGSVTPDANSTVTLMHLDIRPSTGTGTLRQINFLVTLSNENIDSTTTQAFQQQARFYLEYAPDGQTWQQIPTAVAWSFRRVVALESGATVRLTPNSALRLRASGIPCELVGNSVDVNLHLSQGTPTIVVDGVSDIRYTERANAHLINACAPPSVVVTQLPQLQTASIEPNTSTPITLFYAQLQPSRPSSRLYAAGSFTLTPTNAVDATTSKAMRDMTFTLQYSANGQQWQTLGTSGYTAYQRVSFRPNTFNVTVAPGSFLRLTASRLPCELSGNGLSTRVLDDRGSVNLLFEGVDLRSVTYQGATGTVQFLSCPSVQRTPINPLLRVNLAELFGSIKEIPISPTQNTNLNFSDPLTVEFSVNTERQGEWQGIVSKGNGVDQYDYHIAITPRNTIGFYTEQNGGTWYEGTRTIRREVWDDVIVTVGRCVIRTDNTRDDCQLKIYVNGTEDTVRLSPGFDPAQYPTSEAIALGAPGTESITIGAWSGPARLYRLTGLLDNIIIYNRVLSSVEAIARRFR